MKDQSHIVQIAQKGKPLSKLQLQFNKRIEYLHKLQAEHARLLMWMPEVRRQVEAHITPAAQLLQQAKAEAVKVLDYQHQDVFFRYDEKKTLSSLICRMGYGLICHGFEELKPIFEKHYGGTFHEAQAQEMAKFQDMMRQKAKAAFGFELDVSDVDTSDIDAFMAQSTARWKEMMDALPEEGKEKSTPEALEPSTRTVKTIYTELVKHYHPDREQDEGKRLQKTAIMQRITVAYEKNDLFLLLRMKLEMEGSDSDHLEKLTEKQLHAYNKLLQSQIAELQLSLELIKNPPPPADKYARFMSAKTDKALAQRIQEECSLLGLQRQMTLQEAENYQDRKSLRKTLKELQNYL